MGSGNLFYVHRNPVLYSHQMCFQIVFRDVYNYSLGLRPSTVFYDVLEIGSTYVLI
jgi:hypothetical protein